MRQGSDGYGAKQGTEWLRPFHPRIQSATHTQPPVQSGDIEGGQSHVGHATDWQVMSWPHREKSGFGVVAVSAPCAASHGLIPP